MKKPRSLAALAATVLTFLALPLAAAGDGPLPAGWTVAALTPLGPPSQIPACCRHDDACCNRQAPMDQAPSRKLDELIEVDFDALPVVDVAAPPAGERDPWLVIYDGDGRPHPPLPREPEHGIVRLKPIGQAGVVGLEMRGTFMEEIVAAFYRSPGPFLAGGGIDYAWETHAPVKQRYAWRSVEPDAAGGLRFRTAAGLYHRITGATEPSERFEARAADVAQGLVHAFVVKRGDERALGLILPPGVSIEGDAMRSARTEPPVPDLRSALGALPFSYAELPLGETAGGSVAVSTSSFDAERYRKTGAQVARDYTGVVVVSLSKAKNDPRPTVLVALVSGGRNENAFFFE